MSFSDLEIVGRNVLKIEKNDIGRKVCDESSGEQNMAQLRKSAQQVKEGKIITKTMEDLEAIACE